MDRWVGIPFADRRFRVRAYVFKSRYNVNESGLWPFGCRIIYHKGTWTTIGFMFHLLTIADCTVKVMF